MHVRTTLRRLAVVAASGALLLGGAAPASAGSPHFIKKHTTAELDGFSLTIEFKEAGLESGSVETVEASAHLDAAYQCVNNGGHNPNDPKKTTISQDVSQSGQFTAGRNGNISGSLTITPPAADSVLDCPNGQTATLTAVQYSDVSVEDLTSGAFLAIAGVFSAGGLID